uniref:Uncharacterized protein n=1 Tax=viral metagenome TaxID=1070528 RepID=A0A6M3JFB0_9ZZZZ
MAGEILKDLIGKLILIIIILAFCSYAAAVSPSDDPRDYGRTPQAWVETEYWLDK